MNKKWDLPLVKLPKNKCMLYHTIRIGKQSFCSCQHQFSIMEKDNYSIYYGNKSRKSTKYITDWKMIPVDQVYQVCRW